MVERIWILAAISISFFSGCAASQARMQCVQWRAQGYMFSTISSCTQCIGELGAENRDAVAGCALGLDAASLFPVR